MSVLDMAETFSQWCVMYWRHNCFTHRCGHIVSYVLDKK